MESVAQISRDRGINEQTLYSWRRSRRQQGDPGAGDGCSAQRWSAAAKLAVVLVTVDFQVTGLVAFCQKRGLNPHQVAGCGPTMQPRLPRSRITGSHTASIRNSPGRKGAWRGSFARKRRPWLFKRRSALGRSPSKPVARRTRAASPQPRGADANSSRGSRSKSARIPI